MTSSATFLSPSASFGDEELERRLSQRLERVEDVLANATRHTDPIIGSATQHLLSAGGKRLRPLLVLLTSELGDSQRPGIVEASAVVELTHLASLYHDDVMDSASMRRGAPAAQTVYGNNVAILTGDLLFSQASQIVAGLGPKAVFIQAKTFERLCIGQMHETIGPQPGDDPVDHYLRVLADKTGSLIATSAHFGAMLAGCDEAVIDALVRYGEKVGVAFQLADDVIDLVSPPEVTGKTPGTDLRDGVTTMPVLLLRAQAALDGSASQALPTDPQTDSQRLVSQIDAGLDDDAALAAVIADLRQHPAVEQTREIAHSWARDAVAELTPIPDGAVKDALVAFAKMTVGRLS